MNPYSFNLDEMSDDGVLKENLTELHSNHALEMQFKSKTSGRALMPSYDCSHDFVKLH